MPFVSERQRRFMWANHPNIARRWTQEHGSKPLSEMVPKPKRRRRKRA